VGKSRNPKQRLRHHMAYMRGNPRLRAWLQYLKSTGTRPRLTIMDICTPREAHQAELDCIAAIRAIRGDGCLNS
jgi:hypothetical protein